MTTLEIKRGITTSEVMEFVMETCCSCGVPFMITKQKQKELKATKQNFYCINGHAQHYINSEADKLKEQLENERRHAKKQEDMLLDEISKRQKLENQLKRVHKGVCPCCNRTFANLKKHMITKHFDLLSPKTDTNDTKI